MKRYGILFLIFTSAFFLNSCSNPFKKESPPQKPQESQQPSTKTVTVKTIVPQTLPVQKQCIGKVVSKKEMVVSSLVSGMIESVSGEIGDKVEKGSILAKVDTKTNLTQISLENIETSYENTMKLYEATKDSIKKDLDLAWKQYQNAKLNEENVFNTTEKQLKALYEQLESIKTQKENAKKNMEASKTVAQKNLENAMLALENFTKTSQKNLETLELQKSTLLDKKSALFNQMYTLLYAFHTQINPILENIDRILGVTEQNKKYNDSYEIYLSAKNFSLLKKAFHQFEATNTQYLSIKEMFGDPQNQETTLHIFETMKTLIQNLDSLIATTIDVLNNTPDSQFLSQQQIQSMKQTLITFQNSLVGNNGMQPMFVQLSNNLQDIENSLITMENTIETTKTQIETQKKTLQKAIEIAKKSIEQIETTGESTIEGILSNKEVTKAQIQSTLESLIASRKTAKSATKLAKQQYESAKKKYDIQIVTINNQLDTILGQKKQVEQQLKNSLIIAPFGGIITEKNIEPGSIVSPGMKLFTLVDDTKKKIICELQADDIKEFQVGQKIKRTPLNDTSFTGIGVISYLWNIKDPFSKLFKMEIEFSSKHSHVLIGELVQVTFQNNRAQKKQIIIPYSALIIKSNGNTFVYTLDKENKVQERPITIGESFQGNVIVTKGLKAGDVIITQGVLSVSPGETVTIRE